MKSFKSKLSLLDFNFGKYHPDDDIIDFRGGNGKAVGCNLPSYVLFLKGSSRAYKPRFWSQLTVKQIILSLIRVDTRDTLNDPSEETSLPRPPPLGSFFFSPKVFFKGTKTVLGYTVTEYVSQPGSKEGTHEPQVPTSQFPMTTAIFCHFSELY